MSSTTKKMLQIVSDLTEMETVLTSQSFNILDSVYLSIEILLFSQMSIGMYDVFRLTYTLSTTIYTKLMGSIYII